ncbi:MAG: bifunctional diguanylate cyclase/phosphodiesterase [Microthrixaceae bacterium]
MQTVPRGGYPEQDRPLDDAELRELALHHAPDLLLVVDDQLSAVWANGAVDRVLGYGPGEMLGTPIVDHVHPDDLALSAGAVAESLRTPGYHLATELRIRRADGSFLTCRVTATTVERGEGSWMVLAVRPMADDQAIADRRAGLAELARSVYLTCAAMRWYEEQDLVPPMLARLAEVVDARTVELAGWEQRGHPAQVVAAWTRDGFRAELLPGAPVAPSATIEALRSVPCVVGSTTGPDGAVRRTVEMLVEPTRGHPGVLRLTFGPTMPQWDDANADVVQSMVATVLATARRCAEERRTNELAIRDPLTTLLNRHALLDRLTVMMDRSAPGYQPPVVLFADLNHFKSLNDARGHREGDRLLQAVAAALEGQIRARDLAARIGGDEFVLVIDTPDESTASIEERVRAAVDRALAEWPGVTLAVGAVEVGPHDAAADVLEAADRAMYEDKRRRPPATT